MSDTNEIVRRHLSGLTLNRLGDDRPAGLWIVSLPLPRGGEQALSLSGRAAHAKALGKWYDSPGPRRVLLVADGGNAAPPTLTVDHAAPARASKGVAGCEAAMEVFEHAKPTDLGAIYWERSMLKITWQGRWVGLVMGMRVGSQVHWWEHCNLVRTHETPECLEVEMSGNAPYDIVTSEMIAALAGRDVPVIHKHNWLTGHIYARLHANGVCEVYARHVNAMFVDDGRDLVDAVAVVGFKVDGGDEAIKPLEGAWDGTRTELKLGAATLDLTEPARLATPEKPGSLRAEGGFLVWQPYQGVEAYGGPITASRQGDPYLWRDEAHIIPRGVARTLRFSLSLNPERSPRVQRYLAPAWWYGVCEEFSPEPLLPVANPYDAIIDASRQWFRRYMVQGGFEDGCIPVMHNGDPKTRTTPAAEGDVVGMLCLVAYRTGDAADYDFAMRSAYHHTDVWIDHAAKKVRYQGYNKDAWALPLARVGSSILAWLEHGDGFCIRAAQAVIETAYWWHKNSWPRNAVGRDAYFGHGAMFIYRWLGDDHYREIARDLIHDLACAQWPDGSFGDQGGGAGIHGAAANIVKPWMGWMATQVVLDYLEHFPDDEESLRVARKLVGWLMTERGPRTTRSGASGTTTYQGWTYQHQFRGKPILGVETTPPPTADMHLFHFDYMARLLPYFSMLEDDAKYFDAFAESYESNGTQTISGYYSCASTFNYIPWLQARLWNARLTADGVRIAPRRWGPRTPYEARVMTPAGDVRLAWTGDGEVSATGAPAARVTCDGARLVSK